MKKHGRNILLIAISLILISILIYFVEQALGIEIIQRQSLLPSWNAPIFGALPFI